MHSILFPILLFSLIIAAPELDPWGIIKEVLPLLAFSAPFAVYHQYAQVMFLAGQTYLMFLACHAADSLFTYISHFLSTLLLAQLLHSLYVKENILQIEFRKTCLIVKALNRWILGSCSDHCSKSTSFYLHFDVEDE